MCPRATRLRAVAFTIAAGVGLSACSDIYFDRRETVVPSAGDAMAVNRVTQMIDPWPRASANRNIAFNGEKMQTAVERYRQGRVIPPVNATTSSVAYQQAAQQAGSAQSTTQSVSAPGTSAQASAPAGFRQP
jgi:hypothetical protein